MSTTSVLIAVRREDASRFYRNLSGHQDFRVQLVSELSDALSALGDPNQYIDVLVINSNLGHTYEFINEVRHSYPRLFIVLVDEEADFAMPGQADEISTEPFTDDDLIRRIARLMSDRQLETLRADSLPAVRHFAKALRQASGEAGKQETAVTACKELGYDYVAFYRVESFDPILITLRAQEGSPTLQVAAPNAASSNDLITWVAQNGQSRVIGQGETPNHPLAGKQHCGTVACVPVTVGSQRYGVLVACREKPDSINQENVMMLELVAAQLAAAISKEIIT